MGERLAKRVLLIGWDAADWQMIRPLMDAGQMPTLRGLVDRGVWGNLVTLQPILSPMIWTSIATGKRPAKHGIYGFTEPLPGGASEGHLITRAELDQMLDEYYTARGWDVATGSPSREKLLELGLENAADQLSNQRQHPGTD
jgi:predicted AlkP superfamily phosphohydrolase/phosphomutase